MSFADFVIICEYVFENTLSTTFENWDIGLCSFNLETNYFYFEIEYVVLSSKDRIIKR